MIQTKQLSIILFSTFLLACSNQSPSHTPIVHAKTNPATQTGKASYYADKYQSRKTASGERFDQFKNTAAHKRLAFGTKVRVTNINNGKSVTVRINDRGPFVKGRIIDLSKSAFNAIANTRLGVIDVIIKIIN